MQPRKKIVDISVKSKAQEIYPTRHVVTLTYDDKSTEKTSMNGKDLAEILAKRFDNLSLNGSSFMGSFTLETYVKGDSRGSRVHRETLSKKDVIALFNANYQPEQSIDVTPRLKN